jgi:hypothetical protein
MTVFLSYSRIDAVIALRIASELRSLGVQIWVDQLDIPAGVAWDSSVHEALKLSESVVILLSKSSVESPNVLDEIAYAIDEQRQIVPVLLEPCEKPFRLRRLQHIDLSGDFAAAIEKIRVALSSNINGIPSSKPSTLLEKTPERTTSRSGQQPSAADIRKKLKQEPALKPAVSTPMTEKRAEPIQRASTPTKETQQNAKLEAAASAKTGSSRSWMDFFVDVFVVLLISLAFGALLWYTENPERGVAGFCLMVILVPAAMVLIRI